MKKDISSLLCFIAGLLLAGEWAIDSAIKHEIQDFMGLGFGIYFLGKGFFIRDVTSYLRGEFPKKPS